MKILVVDDDQSTREVVCEIIQGEGFSVLAAGSGEEALDLLSYQSVGVVISDIRMVALDGMKLLSRIKQQNLDCVVILMTAFGSAETTLESIRNGAFDYIGKPFRIDHLKSVVERAVRHHETLRQNGKSDCSVPNINWVGTNPLIGKSVEMLEVYKTVGRAALCDSSVLLLGESGTGKELIARMIHDNSARKDKKFVPVNCGALAESLLESELFGHVKGAFTGAFANKQGLLHEADEGTLFLDEVGDMPLSLQVKLLRALQEGELKPVGSNEVIRVETRLIAATHRDLEQMVKEGKFRDDLFYRLKVLSLRLPPLRERKEDLPELVTFFVAYHAERSKKKVSHVSEEAMELLSNYSWPGNVRELKHALERAVAMTRTTVLFPEDFPEEISVVRGESTSKSLIVGGATETKSLDAMERQHILEVLRSVGFSKAEAARVLGISRVTLYRKAKRYGIPLEPQSRS